MAKNLIGIDLGGTNLRAAVVNEAGAILGQARTETMATEGAAAVLKRLAIVARGAVEEAGLEMTDIVACCVGSPGPLDADEGVVLFSPNLPGWQDVRVAEEMTRAIDVPTYLENDANAAGWGEFWMGAGRGATEMVIYTLGTGVGGCVIVEGNLHRGRDQMAGHLGHAILVPGGRQCNCGAHGCVEQYCSATAVALEAQVATERGPTELQIDSTMDVLDNTRVLSYNGLRRVRRKENGEMLVQLSSKGQLVIPKPIREALNLRAGTRFHVQVDEDKIILEPITPSIVDALYGRYADEDLLEALEAEHRQELLNEP